MRVAAAVCLVALFAEVVEVVEAQQVFSKYSLKPPFVPEDNDRWETGAGAKVENDYIRLTPSLPSRTGYLWSRIPNTEITDWETTIEFSITGEQDGGGEGFGFWYVEKRMLGPVFGSADYWNGLGIFFDTYNNDRQGQSPMVVAMYNDGTRAYAAHDDGVRQAVGKCHAPYLRNRNQRSVARISYKQKLLKVELAFDSPGGVPSFQHCLEARLELGMDKFFGFTAHTGSPIVTTPPSPQIADNHDIYSITTKNLSPDATQQTRTRSRDDYRREVEENHAQMPDYQATDARQFKHDVTALLGQVEGALQLLDQSQLTVQNKLQEAHRADIDRDEARKRTDAATKDLANRDAGDLKQLLNILVQSQDRLLQSKPAANTNNNNPAQPIYAQLSTNYATMYEELRALRTSLQQAQGGQANGAASSSAADMTLQVRAGMTQEFQGYRNQQQRATRELQSTLGAIQRNTRDANNLLAFDPEASSGGASFGWVPTLLLTVLFLEVVALVVLQLKGGAGILPASMRSKARDKFV